MRVGEQSLFTELDSTACRDRFGRLPVNGGVQVLDRSHVLTQRWHEARAGGIGASEIAAMLGTAPPAFGSPFSLWWAKYAGHERSSTYAAHVGNHLEPVVADLFAEQHPELYVCRPAGALYRHPVHPHMLCTPDFVAYGGGEYVEPVECKSDEGGPGWGERGTDQIPEHHWCQLVAQCVILGAWRGHLARLAGKRLSLYVVEIGTREMAAFEGWAKAGRWLLDQVAAGIPPDLDASEATTAALKDMHAGVLLDSEAAVTPDLVSEFEHAYDVLDAAQARYNLARNRLRAAMGRHQWAVDAATGRRVAKRIIYKRTGYSVAPGQVDSLRRHNHPIITRD